MDYADESVSMKIQLSRVLAWVRRSATRFRWRSGRRDLRRELKEQATEDYWRRRERDRSRRFRLVALWYHFSSFRAGARDSIEVVRGAVPALLRALASGGLLLAAVLALEMGLACCAAPWLVPTGDVTPPLGAFPTLAVQVSASLLGFYLASVSIVLGTSYHDVSADVRALVLGNARTRLYLASMGLAIGAGLTLVLLQSFRIPFGYLTVIAYTLLFVFSGWAFFQLAFGAFNLFNPIVLSTEPLRALYRAIGRLDSKGLLRDEAVLRARAQEANRALGTLANLIDLTSKRASVDRSELAQMVENLLLQVQFYARSKHLLAPSSAWFIPEPVYPKWIETDHSRVSMALDTSMPLRPQMEPVVDWLERRSAELASAALEACVAVDDRDAALRIINVVASAARTLAQCSRLDDALALATIIRDRCWGLQSENDTADAVAAQPPLLLASLLLGWRDAIASWPDEIRAAVAATEWDRANTTVVQIRGTTRVWTAAQRLLREVHAEHEIEGQRATPDWYLRYALAGETVLALREFAKQLPDLLDDYFTGAALARSSPAVKAGTGAQALQALAKAELVVDTIPRTVHELEELRRGHDAQPAEEFDGLDERVRSCRSPILERIAEAVTRLHPERSKSGPDLFGEAWFTLVHHTEQAIASGDVGLVKSVFPKILCATMILQEHVMSTYKRPTYEFNPAILDPMIDLLELSGLAVVYDSLRDDRSADPVRQAWVTHVNSSDQPEGTAGQVLDMLDLAESSLSLGISARFAARTEWESRLAKRIVEAGFGIPDYFSSSDPPTWTAPLLIKILGVTRTMPRVTLHPHAIFAAEVIGPLSGEMEDALRARRGLQRYYEQRDHYCRSDVPRQASRNENEADEDSSQ